MKVNGNYVWGTIHWVGTYDGKPACGVSGHNFGGIWAWDGNWKLVYRSHYWAKAARHIEDSGRAWWNVQLECWSCNTHKGAKIIPPQKWRTDLGG